MSSTSHAAWFFASLYESRILFITIDGEMGLLVAFGGDADFVLAVGGFHPRYTPPPLPFPSPRRIAVDILNTSVARLRAEGYFATTTNSVQFGAKAEAFFGFDALNVSGHIQFDALIRFSPFYFIVDFSSSFEVKVFGIGVWGLRIRLEVEGPTPWHAHGSAGISLLFFDIDVDIDITWGDRQDTNLPPIAVLPKLVEELSKTDSWRALPPPGSNLLVSLRALPDAQSQLAMHPLGALRISQRFVPLDATLDRVGGQRPSDGKFFSLDVASTTFAKRGDVDEQFAPAQFSDLSDDDRLARKAFELRHGGVELSSKGPQYESGAAIVRNNRYELITVDTNARRHRRPFARARQPALLPLARRRGGVPLVAQRQAAEGQGPGGGRRQGDRRGLRGGDGHRQLGGQHGEHALHERRRGTGVDRRRGRSRPRVGRSAARHPAVRAGELMTEVPGSYTFLPWLRQGVARTIIAADGDTSVKLRATAKVELNATGTGLDGSHLEQGFARDVELYGPGEVIGIENRAIIRTEPHPWITNAEPEYLAAIEFYEEDFPWRYTPTAADVTHLRLRPWITLVVLEDTGDPATSEFRDARAVAQRPLPFVSVKDFTAFPPADELWAWAHVHVNGQFTASPSELVAADVPAAVDRVASALTGNPDLGYSRLLCPRRLKENAAYHAFLIPTFERGRLAGLGMDPDQAPFASASAWAEYADRPESLNLPYYYRWYFRTGGVGDFESLVRLLSWETVDPRVGHRDLDVQAPGSNIDGILDVDLNGVLRLGGALRAPFDTLSPQGQADFTKYETWARHPWPHPFQERLAAFIDLADDFTRTASDVARTDAGLPPEDDDDVDPLITPPIYGEWQALQHRLLTDADGNGLDPNDNWIHELNLDPRHRVAAGFGTDVVVANQEDYMEAAWQQVGDVLAHNQKARLALTWASIGDAVYAKSISPYLTAPSRLLAFTAPVQRRIVTEGATVSFTRTQSTTPLVLTSPTMRRIVRPGGPVARRLDLASGPHAARMLEAASSGTITAAPPKVAPAGAESVESVGAAAEHARRFPPDWLVALAHRAPWLPWVLLLVALVLFVLGVVLGGAALALLLVAAVVGGAATAVYVAGRLPEVGQVLGADLDEPAAVDALPPGPKFEFGKPVTSGLGGLFGHDNAQAVRFRQALRDWAAFATEAAVAGQAPPRCRPRIAAGCRVGR